MLETKKLEKMRANAKLLLQDIDETLKQEAIIQRRIKDIQMNPSIGKSEEELDNYLRQRGVKVARMGN